MSNPELRGLVLTRSERLIVVAISYLFCAPLIYGNGRKLLSYVYRIYLESRREIQQEREEERRREAQAPPAATG